MVDERLDTPPPQLAVDPLEVLDERPVDDARPVNAPEPLHQNVHLLLLARHLGHRHEEVLALDPRTQDEGVLELEAQGDVLGHGRRGGRCQGDRRDTAEASTVLPQPREVGAEVMAPLADAVRLVHRQAAHRQLREHPCEVRLTEALGGDVEEVQVPRRRGVQSARPLRSADRGVHVSGPDTAGLERVDLVLHEGDQRADHQGQALRHHRGELIDQRLTAPGGHRQEHVSPRENGVDGALLRAAIILDPEDPAQGLEHPRIPGPALTSLAFHRADSAARAGRRHGVISRQLEARAVPRAPAPPRERGAPTRPRSRRALTAPGRGGPPPAARRAGSPHRGPQGSETRRCPSE